jgi:hypothetical protein
MAGMPGSEQPYHWDLEDELDAAEAGRSLNATLPRSLPEDIKPELRTIPEHKARPLLKRATAQDLQAARAIVDKALNESSQLNRARVDKPLRNKYGLRPGTVVGGGTAPGSSSLTSINQDVPPLLVITDEIAAAAALVAEAEMVGSWNGSEASTLNITRRAAAGGKGTYWMQG